MTTRYSNGSTAWEIDEGRFKMYSYRSSNQVGELTYGSVYSINEQRWYERFEIHYPSDGYFGVCSGFGSSWTDGQMRLYVDNSGTTVRGDLFMADDIRIVDSNVLCGLNQDSYGLALFYARSSAENCYVRVSPSGRIDLCAPGGVYANGTRIGS